MHILETRIPPLVLVFLFAFIMYALSLSSASYTMLPKDFDSLQKGLYTLLTLSGLGLAIAGVLSFRKAKTTVDPRDPTKSEKLVVVGVYRLTRNPMYVGFLLWLLAWGIYLNDVASFLFAFLFIPYMNRFQIRVEERFLQQQFGDSFSSYITKVRRWL